MHLVPAERRDHRGLGEQVRHRNVTHIQPAGEGAVGEAGEVEVADLVAVLADDLADQPVARVLALAPGEVVEVLAGARDRAEDPGPATGDVEAGGGQLTDPAALLVGLLLNSLLGWAWADSVAALVIVVFAVREGIEAWKGDACCATPLPALTGEREPGDCWDGCCAAAEGGAVELGGRSA